MNKIPHTQLNPLSERATMLIESINESIALYQSTFEKINEQISAMSAGITDLLKRLSPKYITEEQYETYVLNARQLGMSCWGIHPDFQHNWFCMDFNTMSSIIEECMNDVNSSIDSCFNAIIEDVKKDYVCVIKEAQLCFHNQCYRACCSLLLSQIDRVFQSFVFDFCKQKRIYTKRVRNTLNEEINENYDINHHDIGTLMLWISLKETFDIMYDKVELEHYCKDDDLDKINRHCVQHGYSLHTFSEYDCLQLSTVLYSVINMTCGWKTITSKSFSMMGMLVENNKDKC